MGRYGIRTSRAALCIAFLFLLAVRVSAGEPEAAGQAVETATHEQIGVLSPCGASSDPWRLVGFCLDHDDRIVALLTRSGNSPRRRADTGEAESEKDGAPPSLVRFLDMEGKPLTEWPVDFVAQAINVRPNGELVIGGDGYLARYDQQGRQLAKAEAPHIVATRQDPEALDRAAREMVEAQRNSIAQALQQFEQQKKELEAKPETELTEEERLLKPQIDEILKSYRQLSEQQGGAGEPRPEDIEQMKQALVGQQRTINAIASDDRYVYVTCRGKGFGYAVWRTDAEFDNPLQTIDGLKGCCGQMDVQCSGGELVVSENARHRVVRFDAEGKQVDAWGKRSRDGEGENFGGCCNPMNSRLVGGKLYVAESDGRVKLFSPGGEYLGLVGTARVEPGCKSSIVDVSSDGQYVYYFDVQKSSICQLKRKPSADQQAAN